MAISHRASGTWAYAASGSVTTTLPTHAAGDMLIVRVAAKSGTIDLLSPTTNTAGWVRAGLVTGSTVSGNGTGSVCLAAFYKEATSASETNPTIDFNQTVTQVGHVAISYQKGATDRWASPVGAGGLDEGTANTSHSATINTHVSVTAWDMVDFFTGIRDDCTMTVPNITQAGVTFGTVSEQPATAGTDTSGADGAYDGGYRLATSGTSSAAAVVTSTLSTSETGSSMMTRLRVILGGTFTADASIKATMPQWLDTFTETSNTRLYSHTADMGGIWTGVHEDNGVSGASDHFRTKLFGDGSGGQDTYALEDRFVSNPSFLWTSRHSSDASSLDRIGVGHARALIPSTPFGYYASREATGTGTGLLRIFKNDNGVITSLATLADNFSNEFARNIRFEVTGKSPTTLRARVWAVGDAEPGSWGIDITDNTAAMQYDRGWVSIQTEYEPLEPDAIIDSLYVAGNGAFVADAHISKNGIAGTFTADAEIQGSGTTYNGSFTANAHVQGTVGGTLTADSNISKNDIGGSFSADAYVKKNDIGGTFTADAYIAQTTASSFSADAHIRGTVGGSFAADAYILRAFAGAFTADAHIAATVGGSFTADAYIASTVGGSLTADAHITAPVLGSLTADAYIRRNDIGGAFTADAHVRATVSLTLTADAAIAATVGGSLTADAYIAGTVGGALTADAHIASTQSGTFTADSYVQKTTSGSFTADANVLVVSSASFTADAYIKATIGGTLTADAYVQTTTAGSIAADAHISGTVAGSFTADAHVKKNDIAGSLTADAYIASTFSGSFSADAHIQGTVGGTITANAHISKVGRIVWTTPGNTDAISSTPTFVFLIPPATGNIFFHIELDTVNTFDGVDYRSIKSAFSQTGWEYYNGSTWVAVPASGVSNSYSGNEARYSPATLTTATWYRRIRGGV